MARLVEQLGRTELEVPSISIPLAHEQHAEAEHARERGEASVVPSGSPPEPGEPGADDTSTVDDASRHQQLAGEQLDQARAERDQARALLEQTRKARAETAAVLASEPRDQQAQYARESAQRCGDDARTAQRRAEQLADELAPLGRLARLGDRGRALKAQIAAQRDRERQALAVHHSLTQNAEQLEAALRERHDEWDARHPGAHERHQEAECAHQLAEQRHQMAEDRYAATRARELARQSFPSPTPAQRRLQELEREHAQLRALGERADQARLARVRAELQRLQRATKPRGIEPDGAELLRRRRRGPSGPTIGR